ncbi:MAG: DUF805 domain-containing protein [Acidimicrobiia bacterium]
MTFDEAIRSGFRNYATFTGRASRSEFWWWFLFALGTQAVVYTLSDELGFLLTLGLILPNVAMGVRRLHDTDRSGFWFLIALIPFGNLALLVFFLLEGKKSDNRYGPPPTKGA